MTNVAALVPNWNALRLADIGNRLTQLGTDLRTLEPPYTPRTPLAELSNGFVAVSNETQILIGDCQSGGTKHQRLADRGQLILQRAATLQTNLTQVQAHVGLYRTVVTLFQDGDYPKALSICNTNDFDTLKNSIDREKQTLDQAQTDLANCNFPQVLNLQGPVTNKASFKKVMQEAGQKSAQVKELRELAKSAANWGKVSETLGKLDKAWVQTCLADVQKWVDANNPKRMLEARLNTFKVWFGVLKNRNGEVKDVYTPGNAAAQEQPRGIEIDPFLALLKELKKGFEQQQQGNSLPRDINATFTELQRRIIVWNNN